MLAALTNNEIVLVIAIMFFVFAGVKSLLDNGITIAVIAFGLAIFALAFIVNP